MTGSTDSTPPPAPWPRWLSAAGVLLIALATVAAYFPAARGGLIWDDDAHVTRPELRSFEGLGRIWFEIGASQQYYPLLHSAFWVEHRLWGDEPVGYHAVNIALHLAAAGLVMIIARRLLRERKVAWADVAAWLTGAVFALHPVHVESVAWITEQKNTLSAVFYLGAMLAYLSFDASRRRGTYALALALFVMGLLTKTVTATLPAALLVILWWKRGRLSWKQDVVPLLAWFVLGAAGGLFTAWVEHTIIGAKGREFELSLVQRLLLGGRVVVFYLSKLLWPSELIFVYPRWTVSAAVWWQWLFPAGAAGLLLAALAAARRNRAPLAGLLFFVGTLFPVLGLFNVYPFLFSFVADHFQYLASLGVITLVSGGVAMAVAKVPSGAARAALLAVIPMALGVLTFRQCRMYADIQTLYTTTIERNPACWMAHNNLGVVLRDRGRLDEAIEHYRRALELRPEYPEAHNNLGLVLSAIGRHEEAIAEFREALRLRPANPEALGNLASVLTATGRHREAIESLQLAVRYDGGNAGLHANLGVALQAAGQVAAAVDEFERSLALNPDQPEVRLQLELATAGGQAPDRAASVYERVLRDHPDNFQAHFGLAVALAQMGRAGEAIGHYERVVQLRPDHVEAHNNLAALLARAGRVADAIPHFEQAARLKPDMVEMHMNLAVAYASVGRFDEALAAAARARELARTGPPGMLEKIDGWIEACRKQAAAAQGPR